MTRKAFLAGIVSLFGLVLKPAAFMGALRKLVKPEPKASGISMRYVAAQDRIDILYHQHGFKWEFDQIVTCQVVS